MATKPRLVSQTFKSEHDGSLSLHTNGLTVTGNIHTTGNLTVDGAADVQVTGGATTDEALALAIALG